MMLLKQEMVKSDLDAARNLTSYGVKPLGYIEKLARETPPSISDFVGKVHCGDAVEMMNKMPPNSISCIVTSPPYNLKNSTGNGMKDGRGGKQYSFIG